MPKMQPDDMARKAKQACDDVQRKMDADHRKLMQGAERPKGR